MKHRRSVRMALLAGVLAIAPFAAQAATILSTATLTGSDPGDYISTTAFDSTPTYFGAVFTLTEATHITDAGFGMGRFGNGSAFGAIIDASSLGSPADLANEALAYTTFSLPSLDGNQSTDATGTLSVDLDPGTYAVVFGTGLFGTSGTLPFTEGVTATGAYSFLRADATDTSWGDFGDTLRFFVDGTPIPAPEPATVALMAAGLLGAGSLARRKMRG